MRSIRTVLSCLALAAFLAGVVWSPAIAAAGDQKLVLVNGIPGMAVDVCINGNERKSALPYGQQVIRGVSAAQALVRFYRSNPGTCRGTLLGRRVVSHDEATIVVTKRTPVKVIVYDFARMAGPQPGHSAVTWIHAADLGEIAFKLQFAALDPIAFMPAADPVWNKGDVLFDGAQVLVSEAIELVVTVITRPESSDPIIEPLTTNAREGRRYQWVVVGTSPANGRIVVVDRPA